MSSSEYGLRLKLDFCGSAPSSSSRELANGCNASACIRALSLPSMLLSCCRRCKAYTTSVSSSASIRPSGKISGLSGFSHRTLNWNRKNQVRNGNINNQYKHAKKVYVVMNGQCSYLTTGLLVESSTGSLCWTETAFGTTFLVLLTSTVTKVCMIPILRHPCHLGKSFGRSGRYCSFAAKPDTFLACKNDKLLELSSDTRE